MGEGGFSAGGNSSDTFRLKVRYACTQKILLALLRELLCTLEAALLVRYRLYLPQTCALLLSSFEPSATYSGREYC